MSEQEIYDKEYFEYGLKTGKSGYEDYHWLPDRIYTETRAVMFKLGIRPKERILDIGCAKGFWVKGFRHYGIDAYGVDVSNYALSHADPEVKNFLSKEMPVNEKFDYIVSRNTFEHIEENDLRIILEQCREMTDTMFFTVPLAKTNGGEYIMQAMDTTHKLKWTNEKWISFCQECGWKNVQNFYQIEGIHDKWNSYPNSIGFYILRK